MSDEADSEEKWLPWKIHHSPRRRRMGQRKSGHVTLMDVAQACGLSVSTVSIVLSDAPLAQNVAAATRERIRVKAQELGYHPDAYARSLRRRHSQTVGVLAFDLADPFCVPVVRGIEEGLHEAEYLPLLMDAQTRRPLFDKYLQMILERRAEGLVVIASWVFEETNLLADIKKNHVPIVIVSRDMTAQGFSSILVDNVAGGGMALRHLAELGHKKIAVVRGPEELFDSAPRWEGIAAAARAVGLKIDQKLVRQLKNQGDTMSSFEGGEAATKSLIEAGEEFTAVLAFDDLTALGAIRALEKAGRKVPEDCSVVGFDNVLPGQVSTPGLTTISQPLKEMGAMAAEWALAEIKAAGKQEGALARLHLATPELITRGSTARPK